MREGDRFDNYVLREKIAEGGMAEIFRAERVGVMNISREVCVKCIRPALCTDAEFVRMFIDEARISATLRHSNIVSIDHFGAHEGALFSVMEWVHGTDAAKLAKRLAAQGRAMPVDVALFIVGEVLKALEYAHGKTDNGAWLQIVHRDVTPHNVMISYSGEVKLTDFGIAKATSRLHHTQGDVVKGKVSYMAPEQATGGTLDHRTDLFAVGVVAYELLAARKPFIGANQHEGILAMLRGEHPPLRAMRPEVSYDVEVFVDQLMANKPDDRFADAGAALDALQQIPALGGGQRSLQRLMRELYADVQHSTVLPRFGAAGSVPPQSSPDVDATVQSNPNDLFAYDTTSSAPTTPSKPPKPVERTAPLSVAERTLTANPAPVSHAPAATKSASAPPAPALPVEPAAASVPAKPPRSRVTLAVAGGALLLVVSGAALWATTNRSSTTPETARPPGPTPPTLPPTAPPTPPPTPPTAPVDAQAAVVDASASLDAQEPVRLAHLTVNADPWGYVTVNRVRHEAPVTYELPPGRYRVVCERIRRRVTRSVTLEAGETKRISIDMSDPEEHSR